MARAITAYLASAEERARSAERDAAAAVAVAASERRARRLTVALAGALAGDGADRRRQLPVGDPGAGPGRECAARGRTREGPGRIGAGPSDASIGPDRGGAGGPVRHGAEGADAHPPGGRCRRERRRRGGPTCWPRVARSPSASPRPPPMRRPAGVPGTSPTGSGPRRSSSAVAPGPRPGRARIGSSPREMTRENRATREPGSEANPKPRLTGGPNHANPEALARPDPGRGRLRRGPGRRRRRHDPRRRRPTTWSSTSGARSWR